MTKADLIEEVSRVVEMTRKDSEVIVEAIFDSIVRALASGRQDRDPRLRQFPNAPAAAARWPQSENRHPRGSAVQAHSLFQTEQRTEGSRQPDGDEGTAGRLADARRQFRAFRIPAKRWIISGALGGTNTSVPPSPPPRASSAQNPRKQRTRRTSSFIAGSAHFVLLNLLPLHERPSDGRAVCACRHAGRGG